MAEKFEDLLNQDLDDVARPTILPIGSYLAVVQGQPRMDRSTKKQTPFTEYTLAIAQAGLDVDEAELEACGGIEGKTVRATFYETDKSIWMLADFLKACGATGSIKTARTEVTNCEVGIYVDHEPSQDGQRMFPRVTRTFPGADFLERQQAAE